MLRMNQISILVLTLLMVNGCSWENEETLFPETGICDTIDVSYNEDIVPILSVNCYSCHSNANAPDFAFGIAFEDYADVSASSRLILGAIRYEGGFPAMPQNRDQLDSCQINTFEAWFNAGTPDN